MPRIFGAAVDIGTSQITVQFHDLTNTKCLQTASVQNPQNSMGLDIITRARVAKESGSKADLLRQLVQESVDSLLTDLIEREKEPISNLREIVIVGNTVMHHLFYGLPVDDLLNEPFLSSYIDSRRTTGEEVNISSSNANVYSPPLIGSFIGCDAVAVLLASGIWSDDSMVMTLDVGTNTEIALGNKNQTLICSAASGPAFESMSAQGGMMSEPGAIYHVKIDENTYRPSIETIGSAAPRGICGTGAVSAISELIRVGLLTQSGSLRRVHNSSWCPLDDRPPRYYLVQANPVSGTRAIPITQIDIRMIQQSKAAIRAGIETLLTMSEITVEDVSRVYLTGEFGANLDTSAANRIGLFPQIESHVFQQEAHGAVKGAGLLLDHGKRSHIESCLKRTEYVDLFSNDDFESSYQESRFF